MDAYPLKLNPLLPSDVPENIGDEGNDASQGVAANQVVDSPKIGPNVNLRKKSAQKTMTLPSITTEPTTSTVRCDALSVLQSPVLYQPSEYIQTASGNKIAASSVLCGSQNIRIAGRSIIHPQVMLRGDLAVLRLGKFVIVHSGTTLRPSYKLTKGVMQHIPLTIGDYVTIGSDCVISAASIGSYVVIGDDCVIGRRCILKDNCILLPGTVLPSDTFVPPYTAFGGVPGRLVGELFESAHMDNKEQALSAYKRFLPKE